MSKLTAEAAAVDAMEQQAHQAHQAQQAPAQPAPANPNNALIDQMAQMQSLLSGVVQAQANQNNHQPRRHNERRGRGTGRSAGRGRENGRGTPGNGRPVRPPPGCCWTHGNCFHTGVTCETPADGHEAEATFTNMLGGSRDRCHWL
jgi:hypothetical protein